MKTFLVTGANGHLGYTLSRLLAERGYTVRAGVRDAGDTAKSAPLRDLGIEVVTAELMSPETLEAAMKGVDGVFHVAAVFDVTSSHPRAEVHDPIVRGAENVIRAAAKCGITRVVYTSSTSAVGRARPGEQDLDETHWNDDAIEHYARAKTVAEQRAWLLAAALGVDMVAVLPSAMFGPYYHRDTPTTRPLRLIMKGLLPAALPFGFNFVDVRDVADAHIRAMETPTARGRYIASGTPLSLMDVCKAIKDVDASAKPPTVVLPRAFGVIVPVFDWITAKVTGRPRTLSRALIREYGDTEQRFSSRRIREELGWTTRPFAETIADMVAWFKTHDIRAA